MVTMRQLFFVLLFAALFLDFSVPDILLVREGASAFQWDDEEESAPARRQRSTREERHVDVSPAGSRSIERPPTPTWTERRIRADQSPLLAAWLVPIRRSLVPSLGSASPAEDH